MTQKDTDFVDYFEIERQARQMRAEAARDGIATMTAWIKARFSHSAGTQAA